MAKFVNTPLYVVHVMSIDALDEVSRARHSGMCCLCCVIQRQDFLESHHLDSHVLRHYFDSHVLRCHSPTYCIVISIHSLCSDCILPVDGHASLNSLFFSCSGLAWY